MPIYAYKCSSCGHTQDVLQKLSDAPLTDCPVCGTASYSKQVTAPQFQLKGSGWYVTDFRGGNIAEKDKKDTKDSKADGKTEPAKADANTGAAADAKSDSKGNGTKEAPAATPAPSAPAAAPAPAKPAAANEK